MTCSPPGVRPMSRKCRTISPKIAASWRAWRRKEGLGVWRRTRLRSQAELLNLIVEIKGYRGEDAKKKGNTMRYCWVRGVSNIGKFGRWAFAEFTAVYEIEREVDELIDHFMVEETAG